MAALESVIENTPYDEITVGQSASATKVVTANDLLLFAHMSGNLNPVHLPNDLTVGETVPVAPSMWGGSLFSSLLGNRLPGAGTLYLSQTLAFKGRAQLGDTLTITVTVTEKKADRVVTFDCSLTKPDGEVVAEGVAEVIAPAEKRLLDSADLPEVLLARHQHFDRLQAACKPLPPLPTAVVCPEDDNSLGGALLATTEGLIKPIFLGSKAKIEAVAAETGADLTGIEILDIPSHGAAAARSVEMVHEGRVRAIMKGAVHSDELLMHITKANGGLRTNRRISHVFVMDVPGLKQLLLVSDAAINIAPSLETKVDIVQNSIDLALALGNPTPKVGILSAVEVVNPKIPSTIDAAVLSKMADRGQIKGGIVDGPLAMDNAMDIEAARTKGITSLVAGRADVLIAPNLESGNMLAKELTFVAHAEAAGLVMGAKVPVMLTSRADNEEARLASCALALLHNHYQENGASAVQEPAEEQAEAAQ
ncbi:MAG: bifunctional enoyl-CoA hydratase/phosphate acetyltransferase [Rhodospirillaceae bacterium]